MEWNMEYECFGGFYSRDHECGPDDLYLVHSSCLSESDIYEDISVVGLWWVLLAVVLRHYVSAYSISSM